MKGFILICLGLFAAVSSRAEPLNCELLEREVRAAGAGPAPIGVKRVLWYRLAFASDARQPSSHEQAEATLRGGDSTLRRISYGRTSLTWTITPLLQLPNSAFYYSSRLFELIDHARAAASAAGYVYTDFDIDAFAPPSVSGWYPGMAMIHDRWLYISIPHAGLLVHELGHVFGLPHADGWNNKRPPLTPLDYPPFPSNVFDLPGTYSFETNSFVGKMGVSHLGEPKAYGDPLDIMGPSDAALDFHAAFKRRLGWIAAANLATTQTNGTFRIYSAAVSAVDANRHYALRIDRPILGRVLGELPKEYWLEYSAGPVDDGVAIRWEDRQSATASLFIEAGARSDFRLDKALLQVGRTFRDPAAEISVTAIAKGGTGDDRWIEVAVSLENDPANQAPTINLISSKLRAAVGEEILFTSGAGDTDGDALHFHWAIDRDEFSEEARFVSGGDRLSVRWNEPGVYRVSCEVGDARGGVATAHVILEVGNAPRYQITGRVRDTAGHPIHGVRVHNGLINSEPYDRSDFYSTETDSTGAFSLLSMGPGPFVAGASVFGYRQVLPAREAPITASASGTTLDFVFEALPRVTISAPTILAHGQSSAFTLTRSAPLDQALEVRWRATHPHGERMTLIPAGVASVVIPFTAPVAESVTIQVVLPTEFARDGVTFSYPGWELVNNLWRQTDPPYTTLDGASATISLWDSTRVPLQLSLSAQSPSELQITAPIGAVIRIDASTDLVEWLPRETFTNTSNLSRIPVPNNGASTFYRARTL